MKNRHIIIALFFFTSLALAKEDNKQASTGTTKNRKVASEKECPAKFGTTDDYVGEIKKSMQGKTCYESKEIAESCSIGSGIDVAIAGEARSICEKGLSKALKIAKNAGAYQYLNEQCSKIKMDGSIGSSVRAYCSLSVSSLFDYIFNMN